jgi:hypothetical protein
MNQTPEEIRRDIERTRSNLNSDVDAVAEKVRPSSIAHRQTDKVKQGFVGVKDKVMGKADDFSGTVSAKAHHAADQSGSRMQDAQDMMHDAGEAVKDAPHQVASKTQGNPLAAGLIAFGAGWLVSSLIPASKQEHRAADALKQKAQPMVSELRDTAKGMAEDLKEPAQEAAQQVKATAQDAADTVKTETKGAAEDVKERASEAPQHVKDAKQSAGAGTAGSVSAAGGTFAADPAYDINTAAGPYEDADLEVRTYPDEPGSSGRNTGHP